MKKFYAKVDIESRRETGMYNEISYDTVLFDRPDCSTVFGKLMRTTMFLCWNGDIRFNNEIAKLNEDFEFIGEAPELVAPPYNKPAHWNYDARLGVSSFHKKNIPY